MPVTAGSADECSELLRSPPRVATDLPKIGSCWLFTHLQLHEMPSAEPTRRIDVRRSQKTDFLAAKWSEQQTGAQHRQVPKTLDMHRGHACRRQACSPQGLAWISNFNHSLACVFSETLGYFSHRTSQIVNSRAIGSSSGVQPPPETENHHTAWLKNRPYSI